MKCLVKDCENHLGEGLFIGPMCAPCHKYYETGVFNSSQAAWNKGIELDEENFTALGQLQG